MYLSQFLSYRQLILLLTQPLLFFVVSEIIQQFAAVWIVAVGIIIYSDYFENWAFENESSLDAYHITHMTMFWVNCRCVSFCLDHIWQDIPQLKQESIIWKFIKMVGFCFYIPNVTGGPLINYKDYHKGVSLGKLFF